MKELIASVMMICLLCCATIVIAEANTPVIMFLDIPWGSSVKEVQEHLEARTDNDLSFEKSKPDYFLDREELGLYHNFYSDSLEFYVVPSSGLYFCDVYVNEIHLFFRDDKLVQAAYFFRSDPNNLKQMTAELDRQYGPHTRSVLKQITDVDSYKWEADGRSITAETVQIDAGILNTIPILSLSIPINNNQESLIPGNLSPGLSFFNRSPGSSGLLTDSCTHRAPKRVKG